MIEETTHSGPPTGGLVEELARDDVARKKFLKMAGRSMGAAAAATSLSAFIAACGSSSSSSSAGGSSSSSASSGAASSGNSGAATTTTASAGGDLAIVNYALTLEYLESQFYDKVIASGFFKGAVGSTLKMFGEQEHQHVAALEKVAMSLGTPATKPTGKFPIHSAAQVAKLAATVENLGASAYLGQAGNIKSKTILAAALAIHTVEARHSSVIYSVLKMTPTPDGAFAKPADMPTVLAAVKPFIA